MPAKDNTAPPHNAHAEQAVLGACLLDTNAYYRTREVGLFPGAFYHQPNQMIYSAMGGIIKDHETLDSVLLCTQMAQAGLLETVGGATYIASLTSSVPTSCNAVHYAEAVMEAHRRRQVISACHVATQRSFKTTPSRQVIADLVMELEHVGGDDARRGIETPADMWPSMQLRVESDGATVAGLYTGMDDIDVCVKGLRPSQLWVIGGRPSAGKSAFLLTLASHMCRCYGPGLLSSMDATKEEVMDRLARIVIPYSQYADVYAEQDKNALAGLIAAYSNRLRELPLYIDDRTIYIEDMLYAWRSHLVRHPDTKWIGIDYFQQMQTRERFRNRLDGYNHILAQLKAFRMNTGIPMILLSQLNRMEWREDDGPELHHLKDCGTLEQDAHVVMLLSALDPAKVEVDGQFAFPMQVNIAKQKDGPCKRVVLRFVKPQFLFMSRHRGRDDLPKQTEMMQPEFLEDETVPF